MAAERTATSSATRRRYESPRRVQHAAQTRSAVLDAATRLFAAHGWAGTGMRDVARAAGVSVETVYANFGSKPDLLLAAIDVAVVGDTEAVPLGERPEFVQLGQGKAADRARAAARLVREIHERTYGIGKALREGASGDNDLAKRLADGEARRRVNVEQGVQLVAGRPISITERDGLWAVLGMEVFQLLVERAGWSAARYEEWLADTIGRLLRLDGMEEP
jgi:AcrR family transcriptional regulator